MLGSLVLFTALSAASPAPSPASSVPWLELQHTPLKTLSASLAPPSEASAPQVFDDYLMGDIRESMSREISQFAEDVMPRGKPYATAGSGDDSGGLALICGILGFFPGFGIGHAIAGNVGGFVLFLCIDLVIVGVFFVIFPLIAFSFWYLPSIIVIVVERIVEAFSAANSATRYHGVAEWTPQPGGAGEHLPGAKPAFTLLNF